MITYLLTPALKINSGNPIDKIFYHLPIFLPIQQINNTKVTQKSKIKDKTFKLHWGMKIRWTILILVHVKLLKAK